jgi:hypothetical protein
LQKALGQYRDYVCGETLATNLNFEALSGVEGTKAEFGDAELTLYVKKT